MASLRADHALDAPADAPDYIEGQDYDYNLNRNASSKGFGIATRDLYINRRGFFSQETSDALHELLTHSTSDARASLERLVRWQQPVDAKGNPVPMSREECEGYAVDVDKIAKYIAARQQPLRTGTEGLGKIFYANLNRALLANGSDDGVALLENFEQLPEKVLERFSATERDALSNETIRAGAIETVKKFQPLQQLSLALRKEAAEALGEAMQPKTIRGNSLGDRSSSGFVAKEKPRAGMAGGSGIVAHNGHRASDQSSSRKR